MNIESYINIKEQKSLNILTKLKISHSLIGKIHTNKTKLKMSESKKGSQKESFLFHWTQ